jgi:hypothetical protein
LATNRDLEIEGLPCGVERGTWPLGRTEGNVVHKLLNYPKMQRRREIFTERKWLKIKKEMALEKIVECNKSTGQRNLRDNCVQM